METVFEKVNCAETLCHRVILIGLLAIAIILRLSAFQGYATSDARGYSALADDLARGTLHIPKYVGPPVFPLRLGAYGPTAGLIRLFGLSEVTLAAYPFAVSIAGCLLAYVLARSFFSPLAGLIGLGAVAILPIDVSMASSLWVDAIAAFWANVGVALAYSAFNKSTVPKAVFLGLLSGGFFGVSWLCKEGVVYLIPFVVILGLALQRQTPLALRIKCMMGIAIAAILVLSVETAFYEKLTGDPLFRLHTTERNYEWSPWGFFDESSLSGLVKRLFLDGPIALLRSMSFAPTFAMLGAIWGVVFRKRVFVTPTTWLISLLFMFNFMTTSLKSYKPLLLSDRYLYAIVLPSMILLGGFLSALLLSDDDRRLLTERRFWAVALIAAICTISAFGVRREIILKPQQVQRNVAARLQSSDVIYTDFRTAADLVFFRTGLLLPSNATTIPWEGVDEKGFPEGAYVLINKENIDFLSTTYKYEIPSFVAKPPSTWRRDRSYSSADLYVIHSN